MRKRNLNRGSINKEDNIMCAEKNAVLLLEENEVALRALNIVKAHLDGLPVGQARRILHQAGLFINATTVTTCHSAAFRQVYEEFQGAVQPSS